VVQRQDATFTEWRAESDSPRAQSTTTNRGQRQIMEISIRLARSSDLKDYTNLLQKTYQEAYTNKKLGLTQNLFSREVFSTKDTQNYLKSNLRQSAKQKTWLVFIGSKLIGSITAANKENECELKGFYVATKFQSRGIGKMLFKHAFDFSKRRDMVLDLYAHNRKTINIYRKWGFRVDKKKGVIYSHWPEWPEGLRAKRIYMRLSSRTSA